MGKPSGQRVRDFDGLCDLITSFWLTRGVSRTALGKILHLRGVRHLEDIPPASEGLSMSVAYDEVYRCASLGGASDEALKTVFSIEKRDEVVGVRLHELVRWLPEEFTDRLDAMYFMSEEFSIPEYVLRWGRIRGDLERWATREKKDLSEVQWERLRRAFESLAFPDASVLLTTDEQGKPNVQYWTGSPPHLQPLAS